jgi:hypothetical protein
MLYLTDFFNFKLNICFLNFDLIWKKVQFDLYASINENSSYDAFEWKLS